MRHWKGIGAAVLTTAAAVAMSLGTPLGAQARDEGPRGRAHEHDGSHPVAGARPRAGAAHSRAEGERHAELHRPYPGYEHPRELTRTGRVEHHSELRGHRAEPREHGVYGEPRPRYGLGLSPYWAPYWAADAWWGPWGEYWGPSYPANGPSLSQAFVEGYGAVDLDVRPGRAEVWVDGRYVAEARDLGGSPSYLWLTAGDHDVEIYEDGYATFRGEVDVRPGIVTDLTVDLVRIFSEPSGE